ncbi:MAG TPA: L-2-hydroxyglutarate oxidase [Cryomorphaceae bacterium]|nr:L-2-hydroxyglutarate oxidase [Cryomorphaceae bacterium]
MEQFDFILVGGGIVGAAVSYKIAKAYPEAKVVLIEKEFGLAQHQTGRNSGVIHSGLYYKPGSLKARTCLDGYSQMLDFAREHDVKHEVCGKVVAAVGSEEETRLETLRLRGGENGLNGLRYLDSDELREREPQLNATKALLVPQTGIIHYADAAEAMLKAGRGTVRLQTTVTGFTAEGVTTSQGVVRGKHIIVCAGLQSDRLARRDGVDAGLQIVPFRGDYYELSPRAQAKVKHLIYPVPDPNFPFLGVHFTRMVHGGVECGPNAVFSFAREGYSKTAFSGADTAAALGYGGTWKLFAQHWRYGLGEYERAFSKTKFLKALQRLIPSLELEDLHPGRAGIRAQALRRDGTLEDDFVLRQGARAFHVLNAPSPAATASLAIADEILRQANLVG